MSYIKIKLGEHELALKFNNYGIEQLYKVYREGSLLSFVYAIVWGGYLGNCYAKQTEPELTFDQIIDMIDVMPDAERNAMSEQVSTVLTETQNWKDLTAKGEEIIEDSKKKVIENSVSGT